MTKYETVKNFVADQMYLLDNIAPKVKLGLEIPIKTFLSLPNETMGLNISDLEWCNFFAADFSPSGIPANTKINGEIIANPESNPYETVKALCGHFKYIAEFKHFRPYIQAYGNYGDSHVNSQKQALYENNMDVWQIVSYDNYY